MGAVSGMIEGKSKAFFARCVDFSNFGNCQVNRRSEGRLWTATFGIRSDLFREAGGFDGELLAQEDIDLCFRLNKAGRKTVYQPRVRVQHAHGRESLTALLAYQYRGGQDAGTLVECRYAGNSPRNRLLSRLHNPFLYALFVLPFSLAGTLQTVISNFQEHPDVLLAAPFVLLGKVSCHFGILVSKLRTSSGKSWAKYGRRRTAVKALEYGFLKGSFRMPRVLTLFVTSRCNARCQHCCYWQNLNAGDELTLDEIDGLARSLGKLDKLLVGGGEPFMRRDLPEICEVFFKNNGADMVSIPTNGLNPSLVRDQLLRILAYADGRPVRVNLSLDGTESEHDEIRGVPGGFKKAVEAYGLITALQTDHPNLSLGINSCVMNRNYAALMDLYAVWPGLFPQVNFPGMILLRGAPFDRSLELPSEEQLQLLFARKLSACPGRQPALWRLAEWVNFTAGVRTLRQQAQVIPCEAGRILGVVDETGNVKHCEMLPSIGNIRERSFESIWTSSEAARGRERIAAKECHCTHECNLFESILAHPFAAMRLCLAEGLRSQNAIRLGRRSGSAGTL